MKHLMVYVRKYWKESLIAPLFKMLEATFDLLVPMVVAHIINQGIAQHDLSVVYKNVGILIAMAVIGLTCSFIAQYFSAKVATRTSLGLRNQLMEKIHSFSYADLDKVGSATLITRMSSDINTVQNGVNLFLRLFLRSPFIVIGAMVSAFFIDRRISLIFLVVIIVLSIIVFGIMQITRPMYRNVQSKLDRLTTLTKENLTGVRVIRAFGKEEKEIQDFEVTNQQYVDLQKKVGQISALTNPFTYTIVNLGIIGVLYFGSIYVNDGVLLNGDIIALVNYMSQILVELVKLANLIITISKALASMGRIGSILDMEPSMQYGNEEKIETEDTLLRFEEVSFSYHKTSDNALEKVSFEIKKGQTIGIIGGTGAAKTTLVSLLCRHYDPTEGRIELYGKDIRCYSKEALNSVFAVVPQRAQLFSGTIRSNLIWGNYNADDEVLWAALEKAQAKEFVLEKEGQLDAVVEQDGRNYSGGQKQRLTIARALVKNSEVLILDDSSSALDFATEAKLRKAIKTLNCTTVIVSQRVSSIAHADQILVLNDGLLVGKGTHKELLAQCDLYKEIVDSQLKEEAHE